MENPKIQ